MRHRFVHFVECAVGVAEFLVKGVAILCAVHEGGKGRARVLAYEVEGFLHAHAASLQSLQARNEFFHRLGLLAEGLVEFAPLVGEFREHAPQGRACA